MEVLRGLIYNKSQEETQLRQLSSSAGRLLGLLAASSCPYPQWRGLLSLVSRQACFVLQQVL